MHDEYGWHIGPALQHYRCYHCYCIITNIPRIVDTVDFFQTVVEVLHLSSVDITIQASLSLSQTLHHPSPSIPFARYGHG